jgi:chromosome partitioning protein
MRKIVVANLKGGCGKSTLVHHLALLAVELGRRVLVIDVDEQADVTTRLTGNDAPAPDEPLEFAPGCHVVWAPHYRASTPAESGYDVVLVDTPPKGELVSLAGVARVLVPVSDVDSAKNSAQVLAAARDARVRAIIVLNCIGVAGKRYDTKLSEIEQRLPEHVAMHKVRIPQGGSVKRAAETGNAAWEEPWPGAAGRAMREFCEASLRGVLGEARAA